MKVILVDQEGNQIGIGDKDEAHQGWGVPHRAVSVVVYRIKNRHIELLIQKRSHTKKLWPGFWANAVCTHPVPGESDIDCAVRRLSEELGISVSHDSLIYLWGFYYQAQYTDSWAENEYDNLFICEWSGKVTKDDLEVQAYKWIEMGKLRKHMDSDPDKYAPWFGIIVKREELNRYFSNLEIRRSEETI